MGIEIKRTIRITTQQRIQPGAESGQEGYPLREWTMRIEMLDPQTQTPVPAHFLAKVTYHLHPTFVKHTQVFTEPPFQIQETGWGEFDLKIELQVVEEKGKKMIEHDLNFKAEEYVIDREIVMKNPKPRLLQILGGEGVNGNPGAEGNADGSVLVNGNVGGKGVESARKKKRNERAVDMERLADSLQKLQEDDLLHVVELVHNHKAPESFIKNDVEQGEFHVDLYTLPDNLIRMLWEFCTERGVAG